MERKKRGLDDLISQKSQVVFGEETTGQEAGYKRTIGFKVTEKQYATYKPYSKYYGPEELIGKWRNDLEKIAQEKGKDLESVEAEIRKRLNK